MATRHWPILNETLMPDATGRATLDLISAAGSNLWPHGALSFVDYSSKIGVYGAFPIPKGYVASPAIRLVWTVPTGVATSKVRWEFEYHIVDSGDPNFYGAIEETVAASADTPGVDEDLKRVVTTLALTAGNFAAGGGDTCQFYLKRDPTHADDNYAGAALLAHALFEYTD